MGSGRCSNIHRIANKRQASEDRRISEARGVYYNTGLEAITVYVSHLRYLLLCYTFLIGHSIVLINLYKRF